MLLLSALPVHAQTAPSPALQSLQSPAAEFAIPERALDAPPETERILPRIVPRAEAKRLGGGRGVRVEGFRFEGNTVFSNAELAAVVAPWTNRDLSSQDLQAVREALTRHYIEQGYVTSGALVPDQQVESGIVTLRIVEGRLVEARAEGTRFFRSAYFEQRLMLDSGGPLRIQDLERRLQIFAEDRRIRRISARLDPGDRRGDAVLKLRIDEAPPLRSFAEWNNATPSSLGQQSGRFGVGFSNIAGFGDELSVQLRTTPGLTDFEIGYGIPVTPWDTRLRARYRHSSGDVVEGPLKGGGFGSTAWSAVIGATQPIIRTRSTVLGLGLLAEWRTSKTKLGDVGGGFLGTGADEASGISKLGVVRGVGDWQYRTRTRVFAARQILSFGVPVWGATRNQAKNPDTRFVSSFTQLRAALRMPQMKNVEVVGRADVQLSNQPLMPLEQIGVGGIDTVRGYGTNEVVRDQAVIASLEVRATLFRSPGDRHTLQFAPFIDYAHAWNHKRALFDASAGGLAKIDVGKRRTLLSLGAGLRYRMARRFRAEFYWGVGRRSDPSGALVGAQQHGIHFRVRADLP